MDKTEEKDMVVLVTENNTPIGVMEKLEAHKKGVLHRAVSVFIFNDKKEWLIQRRALVKYHSSGLWSNACCSHPFPNETSLKAAERRLKEEMGLIVSLKHSFDYLYKAEFDNGLVEHEYDEIYVGYSEYVPVPDPLEVMEYKYISILDLKTLVSKNPEEFTFWFKELIPKVKSYLERK